ncbi:cyclic nucleotide-binding domain-containing protein [Actinomadura sp. WMMB 499]|uniref:cyclic nucleotide-binding domain-containing protein n=1 Tax=Actinomadura sp. WMMB 499 TaxID=1219491 RepID=UPI00124581D7|nr:cyclic nucleotide-binding domain-containing protein [Actinomadura sp. WMMB 499]QFG23741.1 cyclic nucleotide-binding domain-containing protein [Actinomadura sp. WMMB 499]
MDEHVRDHTPGTTPASCAGRRRKDVRHRPRRTVRSAAAGPMARHDFWGSLTPVQQAGFLAAAEPARYALGEVLWHEGEIADHVVVIRSGRIRVSVRRDGRERPLAVRGPGDIIGERASLRLRRRSATIVALEDVHAVVMTTREFADYLTRHPEVLTVLEDELYERLTEPPGLVPGLAPGEAAPEPIQSCAGHVCLHGHAMPLQAPQVDLYPQPPCCTSGHGTVHGPVHGTHHAVLHQYGPRPQPALGRGETPHWAGQNCTIMFTDIAGYSGAHRDDDDRLDVKSSMYGLLQEAFTLSNVPWDACYYEDRGDGALIVVPPEVPTASLVDPLIAWLAARLHRHNRRSSELVRFQLRLALHVGPVTPDGHGVSGWPLIQTARLLDAGPFRERLADSGADLGFIASSFVYESVIAHSPGHVDRAAYEPMTSKVKETEVSGWMNLLGGPLPRPRG